MLVCNAQGANLTVYFNHVGEDCPAGGIANSVTIGWSLTQPPDTTNPVAECPILPTPQDVANAAWWGLATKTILPGKAVGTLDSLVVTGLAYDTNVWYKAEAKDEANNISAGIVKRGRTPVAPDTVSPKPVDIRFFR